MHGHALAGTALLAALYGLARATRAQHAVSLPTAVVTGSALLAASTCFGVAVGVAIAFPVVARVSVGRWLGWRALLVLVAAAVAVIAAYLIAHWIYPVTPGPRPGPAVEQSLANPLSSLTTTMHLAGVDLTTLIASFAWVPFPYPSTGALLLAVGVALFVIAGAMYSEASRRRWFLALLILAGAACGCIAMGRAAMQVLFTISPVDLAKTLRYETVLGAPGALFGVPGKSERESGTVRALRHGAS